jgi:hypothetical protein
LERSRIFLFRPDRTKVKHFETFFLRTNVKFFFMGGGQ